MTHYYVVKYYFKNKHQTKIENLGWKLKLTYKKHNTLLMISLIISTTKKTTKKATHTWSDLITDLIGLLKSKGMFFVERIII